MFGVYVTNISSSVGWGSQSSTLQLTLVEDPDHEKQSKDRSGNLLYRDSDGNATTTETATTTPIMEPDPLLIKHSLDGGSTFADGFPKVGTACQFVFKEFKFAGIFQRWTHKQGLGGFTYDVVFESPSKPIAPLKPLETPLAEYQLPRELEDFDFGPQPIKGVSTVQVPSWGSVLAGAATSAASSYATAKFGNSSFSNTPSNTNSIWSGNDLDAGMTYWDTTMNP